jgi:DNA-binding SARP family transcriptional activator
MTPSPMATIQRAVDASRGELLPDDLYDDWTTAPRMRLRESIIGARRRLATTAAAHDPATSIDHLTHLLDLDPYDEWAHEQLANTLTTCGRHGDAWRAELRYRNAMDELGIRPHSLTEAYDNGRGRSLRSDLAHEPATQSERPQIRPTSALPSADDIGSRTPG